MFRALEERYSQRRKRWSERFLRPALSSSRCQPSHSESDSLAPSTCQSGHPNCDSPVTQTSSSNPIESNCPSNSITSTLSQGVSKQHLASGNTVGLLKDEADRDAANRSRTLQQSAAEAAAERRWNNDLLQRFRLTSSTYAAMVEAIDPRMQREATAAELKQKGSGLAHIVSELSLRGVLQSHGAGRDGSQHDE